MIVGSKAARPAPGGARAPRSGNKNLLDSNSKFRDS